MVANVRGEITGVKEAIKSLRQIDPELRKQFTKDARAVAQPIIDDARSRYDETFLSGMKREWIQNGNAKFPYSQAKARRGVKFKVDTSRKTGTAIKIQQTDPAAAIIEVAGKKTANKLGNNLNRFGQPSRFLWRAAEQKLNQVTAEMSRLVAEVMERVNREVK